MKRNFLIIAFILLGFQISAQVGIITIDKNTVEVPLGHWYTLRDKALDNHVFFYSDIETVKSLLQSILLKEDQDIDFPIGKDSEGDIYWEINWESGFKSTIYITTKDGFSLLTCFTE